MTKMRNDLSNYILQTTFYKSLITNLFHNMTITTAATVTITVAGGIMN